MIEECIGHFIAFFYCFEDSEGGEHCSKNDPALFWRVEASHTLLRTCPNKTKNVCLPWPLEHKSHPLMGIGRPPFEKPYGSSGVHTKECYYIFVTTSITRRLCVKLGKNITFICPPSWGRGIIFMFRTS
jgi:hypothetical protein